VYGGDLPYAPALYEPTLLGAGSDGQRLEKYGVMVPAHLFHPVDLRGLRCREVEGLYYVWAHTKYRPRIDFKRNAPLYGGGFCRREVVEELQWLDAQNRSRNDFFLDKRLVLTLGRYELPDNLPVRAAMGVSHVMTLVSVEVGR
jgi:hypothetical protein